MLSTYAIYRENNLYDATSKLTKQVKQEPQVGEEDASPSSHSWESANLL